MNRRATDRTDWVRVALGVIVLVALVVVVLVVLVKLVKEIGV